MILTKKLFDKTIVDITALGALPFYAFITLFSLFTYQVELFFELAAGLIISYILVISIRTFYFKQRPDGETFVNFPEKIDASSFPSLHTLRAVMMTVLISLHYQSIWTALLMSGTAVGVMFSRYYLKRHFFVDIFFGALFGLVLGGLLALSI